MQARLSSRSTGILLLALAGTLGARTATADDAPSAAVTSEKGEKDETPISFIRDVQPILRRSCQGCHQPAKAGGKLVLTSYDVLAKGGRSQTDEPIIVAGKPEESLLFTEVTAAAGARPSMPKDGDPLAPAEIDALRRWIAEGAKNDTPEGFGEDVIDPSRPPTYARPPVISSLAYSSDGALLAVSGFHEVLLVRPTDGAIEARLIGLSERIQSLAFSPDGATLAAVGGSPGRFGEIQLWDVAERKLRLSRSITFDTLYGCSWSPDGKLVAFGCADNSVRAVEASTGNEVLYQGAHGDWVLGTVFSADATHLVSVSRDRSMKLIQVATQQFIDNITSITPGALKGGLMALHRHPTKDELLIGGADGTPKIYRMHREKARQIGDDFNLIRAFEPMPGRIFAAFYDRDGARIVAASSFERSGEVRVYDANEGKLLWKAQLDEAVYAVAFSPDGAQVAAGGFEGKVRIFQAADGTPVRHFVPVPLEL
jgi:WD40 repeat protein/mono/diheme cytochrome c family protein